MSNRQERNKRKARRRQDRHLAYRPALPPGVELRSMLFDWGTKIGFAVRRGDVRNATIMKADRLWRHMDFSVESMVSDLLRHV